MSCYLYVPLHIINSPVLPHWNLTIYTDEMIHLLSFSGEWKGNHTWNRHSFVVHIYYVLYSLYRLNKPLSLFANICKEYCWKSVLTHICSVLFFSKVNHLNPPLLPVNGYVKCNYNEVCGCGCKVDCFISSFVANVLIHCNYANLPS